MLRLVETAFCGADYAGPMSRIVQAIMSHYNITLPRWRDLSEKESLTFIQAAGYRQGVNRAHTFNISDQQRIEWLKKHGNLTNGFKKEIIENLRYPAGESLTYWFVIEPKISKGPAASNYMDKAGEPRRFDAHFAILEDSSEMVSKIELACWKRAYKLRPDEHSTDKRPGTKRGRSYFAKGINGRGWESYSRKFIVGTMELHADVVGQKPFGASLQLHRSAKQLYDEFRESVMDLDSPSEALLSAINSELDFLSRAERLSVPKFTAAVRLAVVGSQEGIMTSTEA
ncbi:hypothetical protein [Nisaea sp.]|uniref:hypothetical protein n=1 Tax=Nisaea sp. TaxID=2024842 RepID=UPI002B2730B1|nr:hypothetical protein [Nisaea sp.]